MGTSCEVLVWVRHTLLMHNGTSGNLHGKQVLLKDVVGTDIGEGYQNKDE